MEITWIIIGVVIVLALFIIGLYNRLIKLRNRVEEAWSDIDVQLKRRYDLIPNLINTVKGYASHEQETFQKVTEARNQAMESQSQGKDAKSQAQAENALSSTLKSLFAVAESYPDLKASENFLELQRELSDTENKIQAARRFYNNQVLSYNNKMQVFPANMIANSFKFKKKDYFELEEGEAREVPKAEF